MLTGRESLIRLIGKRRRRFLPNRNSLFSSSPFQSSLNLCRDDSDRILSGEVVDEMLGDIKHVNDANSSALVACPVCGDRILQEDYVINSHLDSCLSGKRKRKLTQRTLLQLNFMSESKVQNFPDEVLRSRKMAVKNSSENSIVQDACSVVPLSREENNKILHGLTESIDTISSISCNVSTSSLCLSNEMPVHDLHDSKDNISGKMLETFIVGRRYSDQQDIDPGSTVFISRDAQNVKDPNALKVVSADSGCFKILGFLPRKLSQYLSPLIEKYSLRFEGLVTSIPKRSLDIVPIQIVVCHETLDGEKAHKDDEVYKNLWENAVHVVASMKNNPPHFSKYQHNFHLLLQEVLKNNSHLLTDDEKSFIDSFFSLSDDSQRLFIRLYSRKGPWFRTSRISYPDILDVNQAIKELSEKGYMCSIESIDQLRENDMEDILHMLTVSELRDILCLAKKSCSSGARKQDLLASLLSSFADGLCSSLSCMVLDRTGSCISISSKAESLIWRAERVFFLNGEQDLSAFLLVDLGKIKYPTYNSIVSEPIFLDRDRLLAYEEAIEVAQIMDQSLDENMVESVLRCIEIARSHGCTFQTVQSSTHQAVANYIFSASWVYSKVITLGASFLEQEHRYDYAIKLLKQLLSCFTSDGRRGYWTLRLSINFEHLGNTNESLLVAENGLLDPWVRAGPRVALQRRVLRLGRPPRRWKVPSFAKCIQREIHEIHVQGRPLNCQMGAKSRFYNEDGIQCSVEELALQHYAREGGGWQGIHTESGIWLTIFGVLMWDVIFADVPNVFYTKFQSSPLDLGTDSFYSVRKTSVESHLQKIHDGAAEEILIASWEIHFGTVCKGVNWDRHTLNELRAAAACVGGPCLASFCRHLAQDYQSWSSGMPDLLLWRFHGEYGGEAKLVEVKGPRDRLSEQQRAWLLLLMDCGFAVEVCKVRPTPTTST